METTLAKGLKMLEAVARSEGPRGVSDLGRELGMTRSNAHRLLQTLSALGYVRHDPVLGQYEATLRLFELGSAVVSGRDVRTISQPLMQALRQRVDENVILSVRDGCDIVVLDRVEGTRTLRTYTPLGSRNPMHCTSAGKLLLAHAPQDVVDAVMQRLEKFTARTITTAPKLQAELARIRAQGYATAQAEWREDVGGVGAPIRQADGTVAAALGVSGPIGRFKPAQIKAHLPHLLAATEEISKRLGYLADGRYGLSLTR
ncbi:MAG: IclR family transcriptional regulator [Pseudomonadota bacterium]